MRAKEYNVVWAWTHHDGLEDERVAFSSAYVSQQNAAPSLGHEVGEHRDVALASLSLPTFGR